MKTQGFTLIELLLSMAIVGGVLAGIAGLMTGGLRFSSSTIRSADQMREISAVTSYLLDNARSARDVAVGSCTISGVGRDCVALVVPEARSGVPIDTYVQYLYAVEPRSSLSLDFKEADSWADANTNVVMEYREILCDDDATTTVSSCPVAPTYAAELSVTESNGPFLVLDRLSQGVSPYFQVVGGQLILNAQVRSKTLSGVNSVPSDGPYSVGTRLRNSP